MKFANFLQKYKLLLLILLAVVLIVLRKPDNIFHAQFVAEDGRYWFADCYRLGLHCLGLPQDGYLQTISRLTGLLSLTVPFHLAPVVFALMALLIQLLPVILLLSRRLEKLHPNFWVRAFLALLYILLPNTGGSYLFLTNSQWYLALTAGLIVAFSPPAAKLWLWLDRIIVLLAGLSGPFAIVLFPVSALKWLKSRNKHDLTILLILLVCAALQAYFVLSFRAVTPRFEGSIPWSLRGVYSLVSIQFVWNLLLSPAGYWRLHAMWPNWHLAAAVLASVILLMTGYAFVKISFSAKLYFIFALLLALAAILFPMGIDRNNLFYNLANDPGGLRYWLIPMTAVLGSLVYCAGPARPTIIKWLARGFLSLSLVGILLSFHYPPTPDYHFPAYARRFEQLKRGDTIAIPMHPVPSYWVMRLTKR